MADVSTIVSILPFKFISDKSCYGLVIEIEPSSYQDPHVFHVMPQVAHAYIDQEKGFMPVYYVSSTVAKSAVEDYTLNVLGVSPEAGPGVFWVPEKYTVAEVKAKFAKELKEADDRQRRWFSTLVDMADNDFNRSGNSRAVSDMQKFAARYLNLERPWLLDLSGEFQRCPYCTTQIRSAAAVCPNCRSILKPEVMKGVQRLEA